MKTNIINVNSISAQREQILSEAEAAAVYNKLSEKDTHHLRLLTEELICMVPELLDFKDGKFWIESVDSDYSIILELKASSYVGMDIDQILAVSTSGKNSARGVVNRIKSMLAVYFSNSLEDAAMMNMIMPSLYSSGSAECVEMMNMIVPSFYIDAMSSSDSEDSTLNWSLDSYKRNVSSQENYKEKEEWDELEKSIIASLADDVKVSIVGKSVRIEIEKNFQEV